jgi:uncharacterized repeat protein (TIGR01451 family)
LDNRRDAAQRQLALRGQPLAGYAVKTVSQGTIRLFDGSRAEKLRHLRDRSALQSVLTHARKTGAGNTANPVFVDPATGLRLLATEQIVLRIKPSVEARKYFASSWPNVRTVWGTTNEFVLTLPDATAEQLFAEVTDRSRHPQVEWAEPDFVSEVIKAFVPNDPFYASRQWPWHNTGQTGGTPGADAKLSEAWDVTIGSPNVVIAFLDDGVQINHPDLAANIFQNPGEIPGNGLDDDLNGFRDDVHGWDFMQSDADPSPEDPEDNHGTAVAGVAAAVGNNNRGVAGAAYGCRILPLNVIDGEFSVSISGMARAMRYAAGLGITGSPVWRGADIINISLVFSPGLIAQSAFQDAVNKGRGGKGCPVFVAAGNAASAWQPIDFYVTNAGTHTLRWEYTKDGSDLFSIGDDAVWLDAVTWSDGTHETFENGFPAGWTTSPDAPWTIVTEGENGERALVGWNGPGSHALRSGRITHRQSTYVETTRFLPAGPMRSWVWVSSELGYDFFRFKVNGVQQFRETGVPLLATQVDYPASLPEAIAVGASTDFDFRSDYSQYGSKLDFVAPSDGGAAGIFTTDRGGTSGYNDGTKDDPDYTRGFGGTSSATPVASGVAALVLSLNPYLTASDVRALLRDTCDKVGAVNYDAAGRNPFYGSGRINAARAVQATKADLSVSIAASADPATQGDLTIYTIIVRNNGPARSGPLLVSNQLPASVSFGSASPAPSSRNGNALTFVGAPLRSGGVTEFKITVTNLFPGTNLVTADVGSDIPEPNLDDNSANLAVAVLPVPAISIAAAEVVEGSAGSAGRLIFGVTLDQPSSRTVTVAYTTATDSAGRLDFKAATGVLTFLPGQVATQIAADTWPDGLDENDEALLVKLSKPVNAVLATTEAIGRILDDDEAPSLTANNITVREGLGARPATFLLRLSAPSGRPVSVDFTTRARTAEEGSDFMATNGTLVFPPGKILQRLSVMVTGDTVYEGTEAFDLELQSPTNVTLSAPHYTCWITDSKLPPRLFISDSIVTEADTDMEAAINLRLSAPAALPVSVRFTTTNGSAGADADYVETNGVVTFLPGETNLPLAVLVRGDFLSESNEFFSVRLFSPTNTTLGDALARVSILDNDPLPSLAIADASVSENATGPTNAVFAVTLSAASGRTVSVRFATASGTATSAADFVARSGSLMFPPGTTSQSMTVTVNKDTLLEPDEVFFVKLSVPIGATLVNTQAVGTILGPALAGMFRVEATAARFIGGNFCLRFQTQAGGQYAVECSSHVTESTSWKPLAGSEAIVGDGEVAEVVDEQAALKPNCFYRIRVLR